MTVKDAGSIPLTRDSVKFSITVEAFTLGAIPAMKMLENKSSISGKVFFKALYLR